MDLFSCFGCLNSDFYRFLCSPSASNEPHNCIIMFDLYNFKFCFRKLSANEGRGFAMSTPYQCQNAPAAIFLACLNPCWQFTLPPPKKKKAGFKSLTQVGSKMLSPLAPRQDEVATSAQIQLLAALCRPQGRLLRLPTKVDPQRFARNRVPHSKVEPFGATSALGCFPGVSLARVSRRP